jgi:hypothetical protein
MVHLPLHLALIIAGAVVALFIGDGEQVAALQLQASLKGSTAQNPITTLLSQETTNRCLDIFIICMGIVLVNLVFLSLLHKRPENDARLFPSWIVLSARLVVAGGLFALKIGTHYWHPTQVLQVTCGAWLALAVLNIFGMQRKHSSIKDTICHVNLAKR